MILFLRSVFLSNIFGSWVPIIIGHDYFKNLYVLYIHVNSTCSRCCCSLPSFFEGCAPDLSQELGDGNEAEFQQYDCPMIQDFLVFWESARGWGRCFVDWMVVFSKSVVWWWLHVVKRRCCFRFSLALLRFFVHSHACQQMMPSPLCFQTPSWRFSVSRLVAIWGFTFLGPCLLWDFSNLRVYSCLWRVDPEILHQQEKMAKDGDARKGHALSWDPRHRELWGDAAWGSS